jgi:hypothetical protein
MRRTTQRWQSFGRRVGLALIGQEEKEAFYFYFRALLCMSTSISNMTGNCSKPIDLEGLGYEETFRIRKKLSCVKNT